MRVLGQDGDGTTVADFRLEHGDDPVRALARLGWATDHPERATRDADDLVLALRVRPAAPTPPERARAHVRRDRDVPADAVPVVHQRAAAYAVVISDRGLLATTFSALTAAGGRWGLPGGGIDPGEQPADAAVREVHEETSQDVEAEGLAYVDTDHWIGRSPRGVIEDYHAVRLVYRARCPAPTDPVVLDVGGTTETARWIPLDGWADLDWAWGSRRVLQVLLAPSARR